MIQCGRRNVIRVVVTVKDELAGDLAMQCRVWVLAHLWHVVLASKRPDNAGWRHLASVVAAGGAGASS